MKKASVALMAVLLIFLSTLIGYIIGHQVNGNDIVISYQKAPKATAASTEEGYDAITSDGKLNINTASVGQLLILPDIGEVLAKRIVDYRTKNGDFGSVDDLLLVKGIGEKRLENLRDLITVGG